MRIAVISDIHANLPALEAVLDAADETGVEEVWCLGDAVGYGARPRRCLELLLERCSICLSGNHDLAASGVIDTSVFTSGAATAAKWTRDELGPEGLELLARLGPSSGEREGIGLYHASPRDSVWEYVIDSGSAGEIFDAEQRPVSLIGHSHIALYFTRETASGPVIASVAPEGTVRELGSGQWLVNPGSVGQPRDGDPRAAWALLDTTALRVEYRRAPYPVDEAAEAILAAGLPGSLAERLYEGR